MVRHHFYVRVGQRLRAEQHRLHQLRLRQHYRYLRPIDELLEPHSDVFVRLDHRQRRRLRCGVFLGGKLPTSRQLRLRTILLQLCGPDRMRDMHDDRQLRLVHQQ